MTPPRPPAVLPWISRAPHAPYFITDTGADWHPIGQNDAVGWPDLRGLLDRRKPELVEAYLHGLRDSGVTCLRVMLEYAQTQTTYFERPAGVFNPRMVRFWDDLVALCERIGLHLLLTPFDTYFTWVRWSQHPYNTANGGPCDQREQLMTCLRTRVAIKARLSFATRRWGGSGVVFAWDLWNEMHPAHGGNDPAAFAPFIADLAATLRAEEIAVHGRAHLQTVSVFGPELPLNAALRDAVFRHPALDFATSHLYAEGTIDAPRNTVAPAKAVAGLVLDALAEITDGRPFLDTEHGPIHTFKDHHKTLPEAFDDEYFRHIQWAHLASGAAGGGMRWPNRHPHQLTPGMRQAQAAMARFLPLLNWSDFARQPLGPALTVDDRKVAAFGCGDTRQALVWLVRTGPLDGARLLAAQPARALQVNVPGLATGHYRVTAWNTVRGMAMGDWTVERDASGALRICVAAFTQDCALAITAEPST